MNNALLPLARYRARVNAAFLRGWDDALLNRRANPYERRDFREAYDRGWKTCNANGPLPVWYNEAR